MAKLRINRSVLDSAKDRGNMSTAERKVVEKVLGQANGKGPVSADIGELPLTFLKAMLDDSRLTANQRAKVSIHVHGMNNRDTQNHTDVYQTSVSSSIEFGSLLVTLGNKAPNAEYFINGRWYPVLLNIEFAQGENNISKSVFIQATLSLCEFQYTISRYVFPDLFLDDAGSRCEKLVIEILNYFGFRALQTEATEHNLKLVRAERLSRENGQMIHVTGPVLMNNAYNYWNPMESRSLGTEELPRKVIVEAELEVNEHDRGYYTPYARDNVTISRLPFVRAFSLDLKRYVYIDVDDIQEYEFDSQAMQRLYLPEKMLNVLNRVFSTQVEDLFGDLIQGKHGGVVILACGNPGVGKTLTAEVYAEHTERPLYVLELGELGTNVSEVERNLNSVFTRVARWNAVLQFDECEIFLTERGEDLERSAIVGIFLRLLDYYRGILFLTTNRADVLDHAVRSRVMLKLDYPDLDASARQVIWENMFESANLELVEGTISELAETTLNGRQIRNMCRLAKILHPEGKVTLEEMRSVLTFGAGL